MRLTRILVVGGLMAAVAAGGWYFHQQSLPEAVTARITRGDAVWAVSANVLISAFSMEIKSEQGGRVVASRVQPGAFVQKGEVLFEIDARALELDAKRIATELAAMKARIEIGLPVNFEIEAAKENERNAARLVEQGKLALVELTRAQRSVRALEDKLRTEQSLNQEKLENLQTDLEQKKLEIEKTRIVAPEDGAVSEVFARGGDHIGAGMVLARVIAKERIVQAQVSEENSAGVRPGLSASVQLLGLGGKPFHATIERTLPEFNERTKRFTAFLKVDIPDVMLIPGLTGEAVIMIDRRADAILADRRSMIGHSLFVVRDGRVRLTPVMIGFAGMDYTEILKGVGEGDEVVVGNTAGFRDGQRVRAVAESAR